MESNNNRRTAIILLVIGVVIGLFMFFLGLHLEFDLPQNLTVLIITEILTLEFSLLALLLDTHSKTLNAISELTRFLGGEVVQVLTGERAILAKSKKMVRKVSKEKGEILAMWCVMRYGKRLKKYFKESAGKNVSRLVNVKTAGRENVTDHLVEFIQEIKDGNYKVYPTDHTASEYLIVDRTESLTLIPHVLAMKMYRGLYSTDDHLVNAYVKDFFDLMKQADCLKIPTDAVKKDVEKIIEQWIQRQLTS